MARARVLARELVAGVRSGNAADWRIGLDGLQQLGGREWLLLDQAARWRTGYDGTPVSGVRGWLGSQLDEPSGFVAVVTSFHVDGRIRERAAQVLATKAGPVSAPALAVRLLDHVPQVREQAWQALRPMLGTETATPILDVLLAGRDRQHGSHALNLVVQQLTVVVPDAILLPLLISGSRRAVRRWAFEASHERDLLSTDTMLAGASHDEDQWVRAACADWLMKEPDTRLLVGLLSARSVEARLVALTRVPDNDLDADALDRLLIDRSPRVREQARWRARRRDLDLAGWYRARLASGATPREVEACLEGLVAVGDASDLGAFAGAMGHASARVRSTAVAAVATRTSPSDAASWVAPCLLDESPRVAVAAAQALIRLDASPELADDAWTSAGPGNRRAAWRLARSGGGWARVVADLRAATDVDPDLAGLGRTGIANWLTTNAATTYDMPAPAQLAQVEAHLGVVGLPEEQQRLLAFCAGIGRRSLPLHPAPDIGNGGAPGVAVEPVPSAAVTGRLRAFLRRLRLS